MLASEINETIEKFTDAFNRNDLDRVMTFFSDDAVYEPGDGTTRKGKAQIRAAFEPQFNLAYGAMRFDDHDAIIDAEHRKAVVRFVVRHDLAQARPERLKLRIRKAVTQLVVGERFGWQGLDVFHFDEDGKIEGKFSYGWFGTRPLIQKALG